MPKSSKEATSGDERFTPEHLLRIWEKAVDTQMHFNEMSVKSRQLGLVFVIASLGVAVILLSQGRAFEFPILIHGFTLYLHVAPLIMVTAAFAVWAVKRLDTGVYHMMLRGAVSFGEDLEARHLKKLIGGQKGMTEAISHFSRFSDAKVVQSETGYQYTGMKKITALDKVKQFYRFVIIFYSLQHSLHR